MRFPMCHPKHMVVDQQRDLAYFERYIRPTQYKRLKEVVKNLLPSRVGKALTPLVSKVQDRLGLS
jgi:hypothetical protein